MVTVDAHVRHRSLAPALGTRRRRLRWGLGSFGMVAVLGVVSVVAVAGVGGCASGGDDPGAAEAAPGADAVDGSPRGALANADPREAVIVFAAASLADVMEALGEAAADSMGIEIRISTAASSVLAQQIVHGAGADLFASADPRWMDLLVERSRVEAGAVRAFASNRLVLITPRTRPVTLALDPEIDPTAAFEGRLALAEPDHVPVGMHARAALEWLRWWSLLDDRLLPAADARATLTLVSTGSVDLGIVYATDAAASDDVTVVGTFPRGSHPPIRYVIAPTVDAGPGTKRVLSFLRSRVAVGILVEHGFVVLDD